MQDPSAHASPVRSRVRNGRLALGALSVLIACATPPKPPAPPPPEPETPTPPAAEPPSVWRAIAVPPEPPRQVEPNVEDGQIIYDESGARWLFSSGDEPPRSVEAIDVLPVVSREADGGVGYKLTLRDGRILATRRGLDPFVEVAHLPEGANARSVRFFDGVAVVRTGAGLLRATDGKRFEPVRGLAGHDSVEAILDAKGRGVGLFAPETIAVTRDGGASWAVVPSPGVEARSLRVVDGQIVIEPGGVRDRFGRTVDLATGALERVAIATATRPSLFARRPPRIRPSSPLARIGPDAATPKRTRLELASDYSLRTQIAQDGDRVLTWRPPGYAPPNAWRGVLLGAVGEGVVPFTPEAAKGCNVVDAAVCGDRVALACDDGIRVFHGEKLVADFPGSTRFTIAFESPDSLVALERQTHPKNERRLVRHDLAGTPTVGAPQTVSFPAGDVALRGGCHKPALWAIGRTDAARVDGTGLAPISPIPKGGGAVGIRDDGQLITVSDKLLFFLPSADTAALPNAPGDRVSFAEDGRHGLLVERSGLVRQTDDGGRTWEPIPGPTMTTPQRVLCGATRCQLGAGAVRTGFVKDPSFVPHGDALLPDGPSWATLPPNTVYPTALVCRPDGAAFAGVEIGKEGLAARTGGLLFAGIAAGVTSPGGVRPAVFGEVSGKAITSALPAIGAPQPSTKDRPFGVGVPNEPFLTGGVGLQSPTERRRGGDVVSAYRWDPTGPLVRRVDKGSWSSLLVGPSLLGDDRVADVSQRGTLLTWNRDRVSAFPFPLGAGANRGGVFSLQGDDAAAAIEVDETQVRLVLFHGEDTPRERTLLVRRKSVREAALGLIDSPAPALVLTEITDDGDTELRIRPIQRDLSLGEPTAVPGTRTPADHLMRLPSCGPSPKGTLVRAATTARVTATIDPGRNPRGYLQRYLRITPSSACVERTLLAESPTALHGPVVVAGDGGLGAATGKGAGLRCEPTVTTPLPRPIVPNPQVVTP